MGPTVVAGGGLKRAAGVIFTFNAVARGLGVGAWRAFSTRLGPPWPKAPSRTTPGARADRSPSRTCQLVAVFLERDSLEDSVPR